MKDNIYQYLTVLSKRLLIANKVSVLVSVGFHHYIIENYFDFHEGVKEHEVAEFDPPSEVSISVTSE